MITLEYEEHKKVEEIYETFMKIFMSKKKHNSFKYEKKQHYIYEKPELNKYYYNELGEVQFENINGTIIKLKVYRMHPHKHNGWGGLNGNPILHLVINKVNNNEETLWELEVESGTLHYKAHLSNLELPYDILKENDMDLKNSVDNSEKESTKNKSKSFVSENKTPNTESAETKKIFLLEELNELTNNLKNLENSKELIEWKINGEIEAAKRKIISSYSTQTQETNNKIAETRKQILQFYNSIVEYSTFDTALIGYAFEIIISTTENCEYVYKSILHSYTKRIHDVIDSWDDEEEKYIDVLVKTDITPNYYESSYKEKHKIDELLENGEILKLDEYISHSLKKTKIPFYILESDKLASTINFGKFSYLKPFIDSLIEYRIQNNLKELTKNEMISFIQKYLCESKETLLKNFMDKTNQKIIKYMIPV